MRRFAELTWVELDTMDRNKTTVLLPVGSVEQHGHHLPLGTDDLVLVEVLKQAESLQCELRKKNKANPSLQEILCLPPLLYGNSHEHLNFPGTVSLSCRTLAFVIEDVISSLAMHGFKKLIIFNSHGGNTSLINAYAQEWEQRFGVAVFLLSLWSESFDMEGEDSIFSSPARSDIHAGERETSLILHYRNELVRKEKIDEHWSNDINFQPYYSGWQTENISPGNGTLGQPHLATVEKGRSYASFLAEKLIELIEKII